MIQPTEQVQFIYADDDPDDHVLLADAIKYSSFKYELTSVYSGEELIKYLNENVSDLHLTFLVVDLNMPKFDGLTTIKIIKTRLGLDHLPIYVFTTSGSQEDRKKAKELNVNGFYTKPSSIRELKKIVEEMTLKALHHARLKD